MSASDAAERVVVTLYTREGCHLCEEAKAAMLPVVAQATAELREIDIDDDPGLRAMYNDSVPVIFGRAVGRADEKIHVTTLDTAATKTADMATLVIIGSRETRVITRYGQPPLVYTPRATTGVSA